MKILRTLGLLLGALCGAAGLFATPPSGYQPVSTMQMLDTMKGRKHIIDWTCFVDFGGSSNPASRTTAWLEGVIKGAPPAGLDLWDIGAQHRIYQLKVRLAASGGGQATLLQVTDANGQAVPAANQLQTPDAKGFYIVEPNGGKPGNNRYEISSTTGHLTLEVYYAAHPPPGYPPAMKMFQVEDGGPPCIPPVNEN